MQVFERPTEGGGDTLWASAYVAYGRLTPAYQKFIEGLTAVHKGNGFHLQAKVRGIDVHTDARGYPLNVGGDLRAVHPVVRSNSVTGLKGIFVNRIFTKRIVDLSPDESKQVLNYLFRIVSDNHDLQVRFQWEPTTSPPGKHFVLPQRYARRRIYQERGQGRLVGRAAVI